MSDCEWHAALKEVGDRVQNLTFTTNNAWFWHLMKA